jgi:hypothetical protein
MYIPYRRLENPAIRRMSATENTPVRIWNEPKKKWVTSPIMVSDTPSVIATSVRAGYNLLRREFCMLIDYLLMVGDGR